MAEGAVGGEGFAASLIRADLNRLKGYRWIARSSRAVDEYLAVLNDAAFGGAIARLAGS